MASEQRPDVLREEIPADKYDQLYSSLGDKSGLRDVRPPVLDSHYVPLYKSESVMRHPYDTIVCLEVLGHIELTVVQGSQAGYTCVCSVRNFDPHDHIRFFRDKDEVQDLWRSGIDGERRLVAD